jgi:regulatory protein
VVRLVNEPTPGSMSDLQDEADPEQVARSILLRRLSSAPRTRAELSSDLGKRGIPVDVAERVLNRFVDVGLIDDDAYARSWAESRQRTKGSARSVLRQELRAKGIAETAIVDALDGIDDDAERERARGLVEAKLRSMARLEPVVRERRLVSMLMRRGYHQSVALGVVREILGDLEAPSQESM